MLCSCCERRGEERIIWREERELGKCERCPWCMRPCYVHCYLPSLHDFVSVTSDDLYPKRCECVNFFFCQSELIVLILLSVVYLCPYRLNKKLANQNQLLLRPRYIIIRTLYLYVQCVLSSVHCMCIIFLHAYLGSTKINMNSCCMLDCLFMMGII